MAAIISGAATIGDAATIGNLIRQLRTTRRLSLSELAERSAVSRRALIYWEANTHAPSLAELEAVFTTLGASEAERTRALSLIPAPRAARQLRAGAAPAFHKEAGPQPSGGDLLRALRHRRGLTVEQVATLLGVSPATVSRMETGKTVPDAERLDALLTLLGASVEERGALLEGFLFLAAPLHETAFSGPELRASFQEFAAGHYAYREDKLNDLRFLTFDAQAWRLAAQEPDGRRLLASIRSQYAAYLADFQRYEQANRYAHSALDLHIRGEKVEIGLMRAILASANAEVFGGAQIRPRRGLKLLQGLQLSDWPPAYHAWTLADMAKYLALDNDAETARIRLLEACRIAERANSHTELDLRKLDLARLEIQTGHAERGLSLVSFDPHATPFRRADVELLFAEGMLGMNDSSGAQTWFERACQDIVTYDLSHLRSRADAVAQRL